MLQSYAPANTLYDQAKQMKEADWDRLREHRTEKVLQYSNEHPGVLEAGGSPAKTRSWISRVISSIFAGIRHSLSFALQPFRALFAEATVSENREEFPPLVDEEALSGLEYSKTLRKKQYSFSFVLGFG